MCTNKSTNKSIDCLNCSLPSFFALDDKLMELWTIVDNLDFLKENVTVLSNKQIDAFISSCHLLLMTRLFEMDDLLTDIKSESKMVVDEEENDYPAQETFNDLLDFSINIPPCKGEKTTSRSNPRYFTNGYGQ